MYSKIVTFKLLYHSVTYCNKIKLQLILTCFCLVFFKVNAVCF